MIARFTSAGFALLAFSVATLTGLFSQNPASVVLSRGLLAFVIFFTLGLVLGWAAQRIVDEHERNESRRIHEHFSSDLSGHDSSMAEAGLRAGAEGGAK